MPTATLDEIILSYQGTLEELARKSAVALAGQVISATPVDTGALRGDWSIAVNTDPPDRGGSLNALTAEELDAALVSLQIGGFVKFYNQMPYVRRIEYEGWSQQAPAGMLWTSVSRWNQIVEAIARGT